MSYTQRPILPRSDLANHSRVRRKQNRRYAALIRERQVAKRAQILREVTTAIPASFSSPGLATYATSASRITEGPDVVDQREIDGGVVATPNTPPPTPPGTPPPTPPPTRPPSPKRDHSMIVTLKYSKPLRPKDTTKQDKISSLIVPSTLDPPPRPPLYPVPTPKPSGDPPPNAPPPSPVQAEAGISSGHTLDYLDLATDRISAKMQRVCVSQPD